MTTKTTAKKPRIDKEGSLALTKALAGNGLETINRFAAFRRLLLLMKDTLTRRAYGREKEHIEEAFSLLYDKLWREEGEGWRQLFLFGLTLDATEQTDIRKLAFERFLAEPMSLRSYTETPSGEPLENVEKMTEAEVRKLLAFAFDIPDTMATATTPDAGE